MLVKFKKAVPIIEKIEKAGFEAYFVGGSVRDYLLNKPIEDVDIATSAFPDEVKQIFPKTIDVGIEHGTVIVVYEGENYEITTFRTEDQYVDFRRPKEVTFIRSLKEDLQRRDFTMNAIAMTKDGELIDPFDGQQDIKNQIIRTVGEPEERFKEDALRMMRGVRFVSQLSFYLEKNTYSAIERLAPLLQHISVERIYMEFMKLLKGKNCSKALDLIAESNLYEFLPGFSEYREQLKKATTYISNRNLNEVEVWALLLILFQNESIEELLRKWKMPVKLIRKIKQIIQAYKNRQNESWSNESIYLTGLDIAIHTEKVFCAINNKEADTSVKKIRQTFVGLPIKNRDELAVNGNDLMKWSDKRGGPWVREALEKIELAVIRGEVMNDKEQIKEWYST
ncbi:CCA tRNA nucleotidyltransferase [Pallidibacillus pasinlerensis]|uniref:CCA-adding enzyme n=1 Tax=Pallidibacillus pasinlerensis TaxID=2703818 RepID=A0ABW9ZZ07_9BACI|nr:CCA tRNA nucleotidyltransferase [Pallidibacillus pasinlerensis]NCU16400.1 CCA tRNA nucleotidyltransferase [Pallidibacillus pasinlerensis]